MADCYTCGRTQPDGWLEGRPCYWCGKTVVSQGRNQEHTPTFEELFGPAYPTTDEIDYRDQVMRGLSDAYDVHNDWGKYGR